MCIVYIMILSINRWQILYRCIYDYLCEVHVYNMYTVYNIDKKLMDSWIYLDIYTYRYIYPEFNTHMYPIIHVPT